MTLEQAREKLKELQQKFAAYNHANALIYYDGVTAAPAESAENRAQTLAILGGEYYRLTTGPETVELLEFLDSQKENLNPTEKRIVHLLYKEIQEMQKIPQEEYVAHQKLMAQADAAWHKAKEASDFELFRPYLEQIFANYKKMAGYCAPDKDPYDYWLDHYEEGMDKAQCDAFFSTLRSKIVPLLQKVQQKPQLDDRCIRGSFDPARQEKLAYALMDIIGMDRRHSALSTTEHPFTISFGSHQDVRITTHYYPENVTFSMFSVIHEGGHALYELGIGDEFLYTALDGGVSMGIHESQSRFYENILGRSQAFAQYLFPKIQEIFPQEMEGYTADDFYKAINRVEPSLIRTEADELTYCLHVMVRYELEKAIFEGSLTVAELPARWNRLYKEYLGIDVPDDKHGVLQDSHWAGGNIGYFPTYALGSAYGAQYLRKMKETVDVEECLRNGNFAPINDWNREHIWKYGALMTPKEVFFNATGETFDPLVYAKYLEDKYTALYHL